MDNMKKKQVQCLEENLKTLRQLVPLTMEQLAYDAGVTKMTIQRLESGATKMSYPQYVTIRMIFERIVQRRIEGDPEDTFLQNAITTLLDKKDELSKEEYAQSQKTYKIASVSVFSGIMDGLEACAKLLPLAAILPVKTAVAIGAVGIVATALGSWFKETKQ